MRLVVLALVALVAACQPAQQSESIIIPTLAALPGGQNVDLAGAEQVARGFLERWRAGDLDGMYDLIAFTSQEATSRADFVAIYTESQTAMSLDSLSYQSNALALNGEVVIFNYSVIFNTRLLGEVTDANRDMHLIRDPRAGDWRVAWSRGDIFPEMATGASLRLSPDVPSRANIYDSTGQYTLADQNGRVVVVNVIRDTIPDYPACLDALSAALDQPLTDVQTRLETRPSNWVVDMGIIEAQVWEQTHENLEEACDAQFEGRAVRHYEGGPITANLIGYVGFPDEVDIPALQAAGFPQDAIIGRSGIEAAWDETLRGRPGGVLRIVSPGGEVLREIASVRSQPSQSLWLTLDVELQARIARLLEGAYRDNGYAATSNGASVVVMEIHTGRILAMVSYPTFDNNAFTAFPEMGRARAAEIVEQVQDDRRRPQLNRPTLGTYPLGSVMKLVTSTAATDSGVYELTERYSCSGVWNRDIVRTDWLAGGHGTLTVQGAITQSCNPFFYEAGYNLDNADPFLLPTYARAYGFGAPTGIIDIADAPGLIPDPDWLRTTYGYDWRFSESVNIAIGQGFMTVTPLQVTRMIAAIANDGMVYRPQLVERVGILGETPSHIAQPIVANEMTVRPEVFAMIRAGMCEVTTERYGTAEFVFRDSDLQRIGICGKTGTAQSVGDLPPHAWFASYAPRENPEIAVVVMVENAGEGSGVAAPIARLVWEAIYFPETQPVVWNVTPADAPQGR
jgi:penicillin-binding protein 2